MKESKIITYGLIVACVFAALSFLVPNVRVSASQVFPYDLDTRVNEIKCVFDGINPFDIWNGTVQSEKYVGIPRPDMPAAAFSGRKGVHAYPPWHTTFFWWYGYATKTFCVAINAMVFAGIFVYLLCWVKRRYEPRKDMGLFWCAFILPLAEPLCHCFTTMNYGVLEMGLVLAFAWAYERKLNALLGLVWSLMMIKPQFAILLGWPLLFGRRFVAIAVACATLTAATLFPAYMLHVSPVELVLQIPKIGAPYVISYNPLFWGIARVLGSDIAEYASLAGWCAIILGCGAFSYILRKEDAITLLLPASVFLYMRPYSQPNDFLAAWSLWLFVALLAVECCNAKVSGVKWWMSFLCCEIVHWTFVFAWNMVAFLFEGSTNGLGWIYRAENLIFSALVSVAGVTTLLIAHSRRFSHAIVWRPVNPV